MLLFHKRLLAGDAVHVATSEQDLSPQRNHDHLPAGEYLLQHLLRPAQRHVCRVGRTPNARELTQGHVWQRLACTSRGPFIRLGHPKRRSHDAAPQGPIANQKVHIAAGRHKQILSRLPCQASTADRTVHAWCPARPTRKLAATHEAASRVPGSRGIAPFAFMMPALSS